MAPIYRVKLRWEGFSGAPGFSVFHFRDFTTDPDGTGTGSPAEAQAATDRVGTFAAAFPTIISQGIRLRPEPDVELLEETTGQLLDIYPVTQPAEVMGSNTNNFAGPVGAVINWRTSRVRNGRRIRGRTFMVPLALSIYNTDGSIGPNTRQIIQDAADALVASTGSPDLGVWARPTTPTASDGDWVIAETASVPTMAAVLRSRRD